MRVERLFAILMMTAIVFPISAGILSAHHSVAGYDTQKDMTLRGTIVEYAWKNPHVFVVWAVKDASGKVVQWTGEMNSPTSMIQLGMSKSSIKPGDEVVMVINPSKTGNPMGIIRKITMADGRLVVDRFTPQ